MVGKRFFRGRAGGPCSLQASCGGATAQAALASAWRRFWRGQRLCTSWVSCVLVLWLQMSHFCRHDLPEREVSQAIFGDSTIQQSGGPAVCCLFGLTLSAAHIYYLGGVAPRCGSRPRYGSRPGPKVLGADLNLLHPCLGERPGATCRPPLAGVSAWTNVSGHEEHLLAKSCLQSTALISQCSTFSHCASLVRRRGAYAFSTWDGQLPRTAAANA